MAKKQIEIEIIAKGRPAERSIDKVDKKTKKLGNTTESTGAKMRASWIKVGLAVTGVTVALKKATEAHAVQLKAELALNNALKLNAKQGEATLDMWKDYASELQSVTIYGDEMTLQQVAMLKTMGLSDDKTKELIETAMDYATAFGKDVPSAVRELTMTLSGQLGTIKRSIPSIGEFSKAQLKSGDVIKAVSKLMKGQAKALADTPWGESVQLANQYGDELERLGDQALELGSESGLFAGITARLSDVSLGFRGVSQDIKGFGQIFADVTDEERITWLEDQIKLLEDASKAMGDSSLLQFGDWVDGLFDEDIQANLKQYRVELAKLKQDYKDSGAIVVTLGDQETDAWLSASQGLEEYININKGAGKEQQELQKVGLKTAKGLEDAFVNMAMGVKVSFKDMARSILADLIRIQAKKVVVGLIGSLLPAHTGTTEVKHTGGAIGSTRIPSFHTGVRSDERLAKLQVGEAVINRGGAAKNRGAIEAMNAGMSVGGGGNVTTAEINFNVQAIDASSFNSYLVNNRSTIEGIINSSLATNGSVRRTIKQTI